VRWREESQSDGFAPVGGGVAFIYSKGAEFDSVPISNDAIPDDLGEHRYRWTEGLNVGIPWVMFILILPAGHTLLTANPAPAGARIFQGRLAVYWILQGDDIGRTQVFWTLSSLRGELRADLVRINRSLACDVAPHTDTLAIEDLSRVSDSAVTGAKHNYQRNPWISGSFYLLAVVVIVLSLAVLSRMVNPWMLPSVLIAGLLVLVVVGALQLRNDEVLKDEAFSRLMLETLRRLPLLGRGGNRDRQL